jgi:hypothetical protein
MGILSRRRLGVASGLLFCAVTGGGLKRHETAKWVEKLKSARAPAQVFPTAGPMPRLPEAGGQGVLQAWGGKNPSKWTAEAILANATSSALNEGWSRANVRDVRVAVPVKMVYSRPAENWIARPYGDGQTNASLEFPGWKEKEPPLVASLISFESGDPVVAFRLSGKLGGKFDKLEIQYFVEQPAGSGKFVKRTAEVALQVQNGSRTGEWKVDPEKSWGDLGGSRAVFVRPNGWNDWFPIDFRHPVVNTAELASAAKGLTASKNRPLLDPEKIGVTNASSSSFARLMERSSKRSFGPGINPNSDPQLDQQPYEPQDIHGRLPVGPQVLTTAVGKGWTWVLDKGANAPFKNLYTCFERRNPQAEAAAGVPSGGGWHEIGDAAETIINNLENGPVVVGMATGVPWPTPPSGEFAYQLTDVAVIRWLAPGEALVTGAGEQTWKEEAVWRVNGSNEDRGMGPAGGRNYHWFYFHSDREVCTQEWVHNCVPDAKNSLGVRCK